MKVYEYANIKFYWDKALKRTLRRHKTEHSASTGRLGFAVLFSYNPPEYLWSDGLLHIMEEIIRSRTVLTVPKCGWALETQLARTEMGCIWKAYISLKIKQKIKIKIWKSFYSIKIHFKDLFHLLVLFKMWAQETKNYLLADINSTRQHWLESWDIYFETIYTTNISYMIVSS